MKCVVILVLSLAWGSLGKNISPDFGVYDYHQRIGEVEADRIRKLERDITEITRVTGGSTTTILSVPYQAGLIITFRLIRTSVCGGSIISDTRILTGAHCYNDGNNIAQSITVVVGSNLLFTGGTRLDFTGINLHPGYNPWIIANDLAVVRIPRISYSLTVQPVNLPSGSELNMNFDGTTAVASGFGITRDGDSVGVTQTISSVNLRVISNSECQRTFGNIIQGSILCTSGANRVGICPGDTGGPLVATINRRWVIIGVGSFTPSAGCQANLPSGFSRVTSFVSWIQSA